MEVPHQGFISQFLTPRLSKYSDFRLLNCAESPRVTLVTAEIQPGPDP